jgi:hypothetical protein
MGNVQVLFRQENTDRPQVQEGELLLTEELQRNNQRIGSYTMEVNDEFV